MSETMSGNEFTMTKKSFDIAVSELRKQWEAEQADHVPDAGKGE